MQQIVPQRARNWLYIVAAARAVNDDIYNGHSSFRRQSLNLFLKRSSATVPRIIGQTLNIFELRTFRARHFLIQVNHIF